MLYIGLFFLLLFIIIGIVIYRSGKKSGDTTLNLSNPLTDDPKASNNQGEQSSQSTINTLAGALYTDMNGASLTRDITNWQSAMVLSDTDFIKLYNTFNSKYQLQSGSTFTQWVNDESSFWTLNDSWPVTRNTIQQRLAKLNLK